MDVTKEIARKIEQQGRWGDDGRGSSQEDVLLELQRDGISGRREIPAPPDANRASRSRARLPTSRSSKTTHQPQQSQNQQQQQQQANHRSHQSPHRDHSHLRITRLKMFYITDMEIRKEK